MHTQQHVEQTGALKICGRLQYPLLWYYQDLLYQPKTYLSPNIKNALPPLLKYSYHHGF